jgi:hypothetical protein
MYSWWGKLLSELLPMASSNHAIQAKYHHTALREDDTIGGEINAWVVGEWKYKDLWNSRNVHLLDTTYLLQT